jgi:tRNA nucleotidyltransferase/poly(A) polymerase
MSLQKYKAYIPIPGDIIALKVRFREAGFGLYLVGGAVRDFVLDKPIKDYDLATDATPDDVQDILNNSGIKYVLVGEQFGVVNAIMHDTYEIATFREDSSGGDGRRPDSVSYSTIEADVLRRDLTMNALYFDINTQEILDYVGGYDDIKNGVVRTVGEPSDRFNEDKLRILRAIRFAARTDKELDSGIKDFLTNGYDLNSVSKERIRDEFIKSIQSAKSVVVLLEVYDTYNMFEWIFPGLKINKDFIESNDYMLVIASLLSTNDLNVLQKRFNKLTYSTEEIRNFGVLISLLSLNVESAPLLKRVERLSSLSDTQIKEFGELMGLSSNLIERFCEYELSVKGDVVRKEYGVEGPELGDKIHELEVEIFKNLLGK